MIEALAAIPVIIWASILPALLSVGGAIYATRQANKARGSEVEAARLRELEQRLSDRKIELYEKILNTLGRILTPEVARPMKGRGVRGETEILTSLADFMNTVIIYGSDDVVEVFMKFRRASNIDPPAHVLIRLSADFMLAIRRDLAGGATTLTSMDMMGMRLTDIDTDPEVMAALTDPVDEVFKRYDWIPPWSPEFKPTPAFKGIVS